MSKHFMEEIQSNFHRVEGIWGGGMCPGLWPQVRAEAGTEVALLPAKSASLKGHKNWLDLSVA